MRNIDINDKVVKRLATNEGSSGIGLVVMTVEGNPNNENSDLVVWIDLHDNVRVAYYSKSSELINLSFQGSFEEASASAIVASSITGRSFVVDEIDSSFYQIIES